MQVKWTRQHEQGNLAAHAEFESTEELRGAWERHLVSRQLVLHGDEPDVLESGDTVPITLELAPGITITVTGTVMRHRALASGGIDWLFDLTDLEDTGLESIRQMAGLPAEPLHLSIAASPPPPPEELDALIESYGREETDHIVELLSRLQSVELRSHLASLTAVVKALVARGDIAEAARLLEALGRYAERSSAARAVVTMALEDCLDCFAADDLRDMALLSPYEERVRYVLALAAIGPAVSAHLLEVLRRADDRPSREAVIDALQRFGAPANRLIIAELQKKHLSLEWYYLRNLVLLAGRLRMKDALHYVRLAMENKYPPVRSEALRTLVILEGRNAAGAITAGLSDKDHRVVITSVRLFATLHMLTDSARAFFLAMLDRAGIDEDDIEHDLLIEILRVIAAFDGDGSWEKPLLNLLDVVPGPTVRGSYFQKTGHPPHWRHSGPGQCHWRHRWPSFPCHDHRPPDLGNRPRCPQGAARGS